MDKKIDRYEKTMNEISKNETLDDDMKMTRKFKKRDPTKYPLLSMAFEKKKDKREDDDKKKINIENFHQKKKIQEKKAFISSVSHPLNTIPFFSKIKSVKDDDIKNGNDNNNDQERLQKIANHFISHEANYENKDLSLLPEQFEPQNNVWKFLLVSPTDQGICGSCWAYASNGCLSDRFNLFMGKKYLRECLSPVNQLFCNDIYSFVLKENVEENVQISCRGNVLIFAFTFLKLVGISKKDCQGYIFNPYDVKGINTYVALQQSLDGLGQFQKTRNLYNFTEEKEGGLSCRTYHPYASEEVFPFCDDTYRLHYKYYGSPEQSFFSLFNYKIKQSDEKPDYIRYDIYHWGPVATTFVVFADFYDFDPLKDGVYIHQEQKDEEPIGGHAVEIVGWGIYENIPFWWIKNSWGVNYGFQGYFRFLRGSNHCQIEYNVISLIPNLFFDFSKSSTFSYLKQWIEKSNIFQKTKNIENQEIIQIMKYLYKKQNKLLTDDLVDELFETLQKKGFPFLGFELISYNGFLNSNVTTRCGYKIDSILNMPYLNYDCPHINLPSYSLFLGNIQFPCYPPSSSSSSGFLSSSFMLVFFVLYILFLFFFCLCISRSSFKNNK